MSWIDDAKKDAQAELQREIEERNRKIAAEKLAQENERNRKIELFRQHTDLTRREIEVVLSEARRQRLSVSKGAENHYSKYRRELLGNYYPISKYDPNSDDGYTYLYFAIGWTITEPSTKETCEITLGLTVKEMDKKSLINKHTITYSYTPTTSAAEVENFIKNWLTSIFKHQ